MFSNEGSIQFEKVCGGNIWRKLEGVVSLSKLGDGTRVTLYLTGSTKTLVPELAISGQMKEQLDHMAEPLRKCLEEDDDH
ncbi:MAG: hypothetical protein VCE43_21900 [Myxococcota bacterium]